MAVSTSPSAGPSAARPPFLRRVPARRRSPPAGRARAARRVLRLGLAAMLGAVLLGGAGPSGSARAELIELLDRTKLNAKVVHFYDGVYTVEVAGQTQKIPKDKIRSIGFQLPPPRAELSSPEKTFERWRKALTEGDMERVVDCYALMYQGMLASQMSQSSEAMKKMQKEIDGTRFQIKGSSTKGETATLKVERHKGDDSDTGEVGFVRENGEWKMLPPQQ